VFGGVAYAWFERNADGHPGWKLKLPNTSELLSNIAVAMKALLVTAFVTAAVLSGNAGAQSPKVDELIPKATAYAHYFVDRFSNVVAEERYAQEITAPRRKRILVSEFLLVRYSGDELWQVFRDVAEVDGKPVRDREARIMKLFLQPSSSAVRRAAEISEASARYNLIDIGTINNPLLVMAFLQHQYVDRFRFNLAGLEKDLGPDVRTVRFVEYIRPTVLKSNANNDMFSSGLIWMEEGTGRVVKTQLQLGGVRYPVRVTTTFTSDDDLGIHVPAMMEDWYPQGTGEFRGKATYGKFRRFEVKTSEAPSQNDHVTPLR
jgi:hypothetical protein